MNAGAQRTLAYSWLLLIHQLPAKPAYLRVKIWRRLQDLGAVAVKNAVHALPMNEDTRETSSGCCARSRKEAEKRFSAKRAISASPDSLPQSRRVSAFTRRYWSTQCPASK